MVESSRRPVTLAKHSLAPSLRARPKPDGLPKIVVIGGGTGSFNVLTGLKAYPCSLTAVVAMTDSGGSSGRLRDEFGHLPPGDVRRCLLALSPDDHAGMVLRQLFDYRFNRGNGLDGHSFGNLFLTALTEVTGSTEAAIQEMGRLLGIKGQVLPVTLTNTNLFARLRNGVIIEGETNIDRRTVHPDVPIDYVYLQPKAFVSPGTAKAIEEADAIVIGPGDLYTSILANLAVEGVAHAIVQSRGKRIYVCNIMTKPGESDGFKASDFIREINTYLGVEGKLDCALVNTQSLEERVVQRYAAEHAAPVAFDSAACDALAAKVVGAPLASVGNFVRHDPHRLADAILKLL